MSSEETIKNRYAYIDANFVAIFHAESTKW